MVQISDFETSSDDFDVPSSGETHKGGASELEKLRDGLNQTPKQIPCSFLYDDKGSALYNEITELEEYYPYRVELEMLHENADQIIKQIPRGAVVVELGCGSATKTAILQRALLKRDGADKCTFVGIDVSQDFLQQAKVNMLEACPGLKPEKVELVKASYLDGLRQAHAMHPNEALCVLWLGSSVGNLNPEESLDFFKQIIQLGGPKTQVLLCTDLWKDRKTLHNAYCDSKGVTEAFIKNGLQNAISSAMQCKHAINEDLWTYEVNVNPKLQQVEMNLTAGESVDLGEGCVILKGEKILMEVSRKFTEARIRQLAYQAGFFFQARWNNQQYSIQMLSAPLLAFEMCWQDTDTLFEQIKDWNHVPISLRHPFCFYYGHVIAFSKIKLLPGKYEEGWDEMFSRGIDPDVSDPNKCHSHPDAPSVWPEKNEIIQYCQRGRSAIESALKKKEIELWLCCLALEHERMHQETLCYMLAQERKHVWEKEHLDESGAICMANGFAFEEVMWSKEAEPNSGDRRHGLQGDPFKECHSRNGESVNGYSKVTTESNEKHKCNGNGCSKKLAENWIEVPGSNVVVGVDLNPEFCFGWDNEGPPQEAVHVPSFNANKRPVSIAEYRNFILKKKGYQIREFWDKDGFELIASKQSCPATWTITEDNDIWIHYPEGTWHWEKVQHRPVWCSLKEAEAYCKAKQCRVMSETEYISAMQFADKTNSIKQLDDDGWEHTSTVMKEMKGFKPMKNYEEYSADFYDGKHCILRGSSPYTHFSTKRQSFRNFYQDVYTFEFAKFRCCF